MKKKLIILTICSSIYLPILAFAETGSITPTKDTSLASTTVTCVQAALDKRENSLITSHDSYNTSVKDALTKRLGSLKDVWAQADKKARIDKRQDAYKVFKTDMQSANMSFKTARNSAWKTFEVEAKTCGIKGGTGETPAVITSSNTTL